MTRAAPEKVGLWLVGACGGVGCTTALGIAALAKRRTAATGLVSTLPAFHHLPLVDPGRIVIGGHEIRSETLQSAIHALHQRAGLFDSELIRACVPQLRAFQREIRPGTLLGSERVVRELADAGGLERDKTPAEAIERLSTDISSFRKRLRLDHVVVIHVASSEPPCRIAASHANWSALRRALARRGSSVIPASSIYALAAFEAGCPFINFTPSVGVALPAIQQRARKLGLPFMGCDGKTGETLVKSVLAPMFAMRHLEVMSWVGQNILGNRDGAVLDDPRTRESKIRSKDSVIPKIVGGKPVTRVGIEYVPSLDDWKVAWDFVHFRGFLDTKMSMQFTWSGSDSVLAAPLIIDLTRFAVLERSRGGVGPMRHLGFFFKNPMEVKEHDLFTQWRRLIEHLGGGEL